MSAMRAIVIDERGDPGLLTPRQLPLPIRANAEFLVKVVAAGVNPIDATSRTIGSLPRVPGNDFSGHVVESPYALHPIKVGDEVYGMTIAPRFGGSYAEYVAVPSTCVAKKPRSLSHVEAAAVPFSALTAWGAVVDVAKAHDGQRILIHTGAGGVGHFAIQFASYFGAHVIATGSTRNLGWLRERGAREVIDRSTGRFEELVSNVDVVIDLLGNHADSTSTRSVGVLKPGGLIVIVPTDGVPALDDPSESGSSLAERAAASGVRATGYEVAADGATLSVISRLLESGDVRVFVDEVFELDQAPAAHAALDTGQSRGTIVLTVSPG